MLFWRKPKAGNEDKNAAEPNNEHKIGYAPIAGGSRSSTVSINNSLFGNKKQEISPEFSLEWITILRRLSVFDSNVSRAVTNTTSLANTSYQIELPDNLSKRDRRKIMESIRTFETEANIDSFIRNAIRTVTYSGGLASEAVLELDPYPNAVKKAVILDITNIRFDYDFLKDEFIPKQINAGFLQGKSENILNKKTFFYETIHSFEENPYPIPALLAAIEGIKTQKKMMDNFIIIIEKIGMMGFLEVLVKQPSKKQGESDEAYFSRCTDYLQRLKPQVQEGYAKGMVMGFTDSHDFRYQASNLNFGGAEKAFEIVSKFLNNGLQTDGVFMNQNNNTSETFARVLLQVLIGNIESIQKAVASVLSKVILLHLKLQGFQKVDFLKVIFEKPLIGDSLKEAQTESVNIANTRAKEDAGYISNDIAAQELGYESATGTKKEENKAIPKVEVSPDNNTNPDKDKNVGLSENFKFETDFKDSYLNDAADDYATAIDKKYKKAVKNVVDLTIETIKEFGVRNESDLVSIFILTLEQNWETLFIENSQKNIEKYTQKVYNKYRKDKSIFGEIEEEGETKNTRFFDPPPPIIDFLDLRLIEYLSNSDSFYLGRFITNEASIQRFTQAILDFYVANDGEIGNSQTLSEFSELMQGEMNLQDYQIRRIIDTTMTNARNYANINYLRQAEVDKFRRVEIGDRLTCAHCQAVDGEIYETTRELAKVERFINLGFEEIGDVAPFATTVDIDSFRSLSSSEKQDMGFGAQALHPHCRGRIVADL
ncbi:hypothetical protein ACE193_21655 [Bernardetia sp. OM2101]|uniref:hypothetical protein n=1 Tax=Bernardetia sp. OM2101 TaxID=3344876 RepID=UPI0035CEC1F7